VRSNLSRGAEGEEAGEKGWSCPVMGLTRSQGFRGHSRISKKAHRRRCARSLGRSDSSTASNQRFGKRYNINGVFARGHDDQSRPLPMSARIYCAVDGDNHWPEAGGARRIDSTASGWPAMGSG